MLRFYFSGLASAEEVQVHLDELAARAAKEAAKKAAKPA
jgi:hypothetical protein